MEMQQSADNTGEGASLHEANPELTENSVIAPCIEDAVKVPEEGNSHLPDTNSSHSNANPQYTFYPPGVGFMMGNILHGRGDMRRTEFTSSPSSSHVEGTLNSNILSPVINTNGSGSDLVANNAYTVGGILPLHFARPLHGDTRSNTASPIAFGDILHRDGTRRAEVTSSPASYHYDGRVYGNNMLAPVVNTNGIYGVNNSFGSNPYTVGGILPLDFGRHFHSDSGNLMFSRVQSDTAPLLGVGVGNIHTEGETRRIDGTSSQFSSILDSRLHSVLPPVANANGGRDNYSVGNNSFTVGGVVSHESARHMHVDTGNLQLTRVHANTASTLGVGVGNIHREGETRRNDGTSYQFSSITDGRLHSVLPPVANANGGRDNYSVGNNSFTVGGAVSHESARHMHVDTGNLQLTRVHANTASTLGVGVGNIHREGDTRRNDGTSSQFSSILDGRLHSVLPPVVNANRGRDNYSVGNNSFTVGGVVSHESARHMHVDTGNLQLTRVHANTASTLGVGVGNTLHGEDSDATSHTHTNRSGPRRVSSDDERSRAEAANKADVNSDESTAEELSCLLCDSSSSGAYIVISCGHGIYCKVCVKNILKSSKSCPSKFCRRRVRDMADFLSVYLMS